MEKLRNEKKALADELESIRTGSQEQVEIATAAVQAAEKRESVLQKQLDDREKKDKQAWLQLKLLSVMMEHMTEENGDLVNKAKQHQDAAETAQDRIEMLEDELTEERTKGIRKRLGAVFSRK
ncbi:MAG: hypothetical protein SGARI_007364, partial [Bacillariaceae sp.]